MPEGFTEFDPAEFMKDDADRLYQLNSAFAGMEADSAAETIGDCVRALGVSNTVAATGLSRAALYKSLKIGGNPRLSTVLSLLKSMGFEIGVRKAGTWTALRSALKENDPVLPASGTVIPKKVKRLRKVRRGNEIVEGIVHGTFVIPNVSQQVKRVRKVS